MQVLVVDDNAVVRQLVVAGLRQCGYAVLEAQDGDEALESYRRQPVQVVVTDLGMPRLGGLDLLAALRRQETPPEVICLTGTHASDARAAVQALRLGAHDYIVKDAAAGRALTVAVAGAAEKWRLRQENARLLCELQRLSLTDGLTGVANRRSFDEALQQEVARAQRHDAALSLAIVDIDHFKRVNDQFGHQAGDEILVGFARRLLGVARSSDRLFRYGGEEFAFLLGDTGDLGALALAQRAVETVACAPMTAGQQSLWLTCSAGVAALAPGDTCQETLLKRADAALYDAKRQGRNRAVAARHAAVGRSRPDAAGFAGEPLVGTC